MSDKKYKKGFTAGVFDMFHVGHLNLLKRCKENCDYLMVGVLADQFAYEMKGKYPVISLEDRMEILKSIRYVDEVIPVDYHNTHKPDAWQLYHFDVCFSGDDHKAELGWIEERKQLNLMGSEIIYLPYTERVSTTMLRSKLRDR